MNTKINNNSTNTLVKTVKLSISNKKEFNPYNPENLYKDFDFSEDEIENEEIIKRDDYDNLNQSSNKFSDDQNTKNKFRYQSFSDRIKKIKVKFNSNFENDISFLQIESKKGFKINSTESESNFLAILSREKILNTSDEFKKFENELNIYTQSYLIYVNNSEKILSIFSEKIKNYIDEEIKNIPFIISLLETLTGLIKDLRDECYDEFLDNIFPNIIKLLSETQNIDAIEKTFNVLVNIFKFLQNAILKPRNFSKFFYILSELIFSKTKYIRKFTCESISYLIKNLDEEKLSEIMIIILNPFVCPEKYFEVELNQETVGPMKMDIEEGRKEEKSFNEIYLEKIKNFDVNLDFLALKKHNQNYEDIKNSQTNYFINFLHEALLNFEFDWNYLLGGFDNNSITQIAIENLNKKLKLKIFLIECLSDFIYEILIGVNNDLSIKADIFLEKIKIKIPKNSIENNNKIKNHENNKITKENFEYLNFILDISVVTSLIKLYTKLKNDKKNTTISLLNYYFFKKLKKNILFSKLKNESISNQLTIYQKSYSIDKVNKMEVEENKTIKNRKLTKIKFTNANCLTLINFFIFELFNKHQNKFDKEIIKFFFEFLKLSIKKIDLQEDKYKLSLFNIFHEIKCEIPNKDYFSKNLKIDLLGLLLKFYPEEFIQMFKLDFIPVNPYNKIHKTLNLSVNKELEDLLNLIKIFYNYENAAVEQDEFFDLNCTINLVDENILYLFLEKLKKLQNFKYFKFLSFFVFRPIIKSDTIKFNNESLENLKKNQGNIIEDDQENKKEKNETKTKTKFKIDNLKNQNPYFDNDDYNLVYEPYLINKLFSCIMNIYDYQNVENILDIKTTYDLILIKNTKNEDDIQYNFSAMFNTNDEIKINFDSEDNITSNYKHTNLVIMNENNLKTIVNYLVNFSILENKSEIQENVLNIQKYIQIYSFLITGDLLIKSLSTLESIKNIKSFENEGYTEFRHIKTNQNEIYYTYIKKSIESILVIFENQGFLTEENKSLSGNNSKINFASEILKLTKEDEIMLFNILFRDFNNISTFYIEKSTAFINLLNIFTVNYLRIIYIFSKETNESFSQNFQKENESFLSRILYILFTNCEDGSAFKTINIIIKFFFNNNFMKFYEFCRNQKIFFMRKHSLSKHIYKAFNSSTNNYHEEHHENSQVINSLDEFLFTFSTIFYSNDNKIKREFLTFSQLWLKSENNLNIQSLDEILDLIKHILTLEFDPLNDKKYSLNYEILVSKIELITLGSEDYNALFLFSFFYDFLLGSYWIRLVKTFWPVLTKCIERFFITLGKLFNEKLLWIIFQKSIKIFDFIYRVGTIDDLLEKVDKKIFNKFYFVFIENYEENITNENNLNRKIFMHSYLENIIASSFYAKRDNVSSLALNVNLFYEGFSKSQHNLEIILNASNSILIEKNEDVKNQFFLFENFYKCFSNIINARNENWINELIKTNENNSICESLNENSIPQIYDEKNNFQNSEKFYKNYFNNFIIQKESGKFFGTTYKLMQEAILTITSKLKLNLIYKLKDNNLSQKKDDIKMLLNDQLIFSRSVSNQKLCIQIYMNLEPKLKKFSQLFEKIIDNSNLIDRLYNMKDIKTDTNESITANEREILIPILIRLYYSKYFYLTNKNKKVKTRNKINIVSFFIQLTPEEFQEYIKVIFRPLLIFEMLNHEYCISMYKNETEKSNINLISNNITSKNALSNKFENEILFCENAFIANDFVNANFNEIEQGNFSKINKFEGIKYLDLRIYRKIIEIIALNFKQINSLFESSIDFLTIFIMNVLIFIKKLNNFYKCFFDYKKYIQNMYDSGKHNHTEEEIIFDFQAVNKIGMELNNTSGISYQEELDHFLYTFENHIKKDKKISQSKFISYWEKNKILEYSNLYFKFVKEIKKKSFDLLKRIFSKFSFKTELIKMVTDRLFIEYQEIFNYLPQTQNLKANSLIQFTFNIAKNPIMHKIFIDNSNIFVALCKILTNKTIDNGFLNTLLEFLEDLIIPYSEYKCELEEFQLKSQNNNEYSELRNFSKIDKNSIAKKLSLPDDEKTERPKRRKMTSESNLSFLQSDKYKSEEEDSVNTNNLRNILGERIELNKIDQNLFFENESKLIKQNFKLLNDNLIILLTNGRLKLKIKEYITERTIYLLLELWNIFDINDVYFQEYLNVNQESINKILQILIDFISKDSTIFKNEYKMYLSNILRLCNILISICINKSKFYIDFLHLIYKISDSQSRLILSVILKQINEPINQEIITKFNPEINVINKNFPLKNLNNNFEEVYSMIIKLNILREGKTLDFNDDLDVDLVLENLNLITDEYCQKFLIVHFEPLIYQLISLANFSEDFSIQTLAISKIKNIFEKIIKLFNTYINTNLGAQNIDYLSYLIIKLELEVFANILKVFLNLLNLLNFNTHVNKNTNNNFGSGNFIMMNKLKPEKIKKNIMDLFSFINSTLLKDPENNLLNKNSSQENIALLNMDIYSISTLNLKLFEFNSEIYNKENYFDDYLNVFSLLICKDLYFITSEKGDYDFFEGIINLKFNIRFSVLNQLKTFLVEKKITYFSLINIIIPLVKNFLNLEANESKNIQRNNNKDSFEIFHKKSDLNPIIDLSIELLIPISKMLKKEDFLALLMHFYRKISKANNQEASKNYEDNKFIFEKLYEILNQLLECLNFFKFDFTTEFDFDKEFNNIMRIMISDYKYKASLDVFLNPNANEAKSLSKFKNNSTNKNEENNFLLKLDDSKINQFTNNKSYSKDLFTDSFSKIALIFQEKLNERKKDVIGNTISTELSLSKKDGILKDKKLKLNAFSEDLIKNLFKMLKNMLIDNYRKDKTKKYYIRNFVIKPYFQVLKKMEPKTLKYEMLSLVYEIINNLKNKDLEVREKARQAIKILIETLGPFISNVLFEQLKSQLTSGYQRYILGYTCNFILGILNKLYLNFKEIEEFGETIALKNLMYENQKFLEIDQHLEDDNENKVIKLNEGENKPINMNVEGAVQKNNEKQQNVLKESNSDYNSIINEFNNKNLNLDPLFFTRYKQFNKKDIELVFDFSVGIVVPTLLEEIFGEVAEEKEIEQLVKKCKEAKEVKAYNSFLMLASRMDFKTGILNLIFPIRNFVLDKETNNQIINKLNEIMNFIIKGLKENITLRIEDIILISYSLINIGLEINIKNSKEIRQTKNLTIKGGDICESKKAKNDYQIQKNELVSLQSGTNNKSKFAIEIARKFLMEKNDIIISNLFTQFGLDIFFLSIKKNVFDFNSLKSKLNESQKIIKDNSYSLKENEFNQEKSDLKNYESESSDEYQNELFFDFKNDFADKKLNNDKKHKTYFDKIRVDYSALEFKDIINKIEILLYSVVCCLKINSNNILSKSLKILTKLFDSRLFIIKKNLKKIGSNLFKNLGVINLSESDKPIAQTILSCISEILKKFKFFQINESQMKLLINFLKIYINNLEIKSYIFACLLAIIKRKFLHPCIYDMIDYIQETYLISFDEATKSLCENIFIEFLNNYPLEDTRKQKYINFFIINLESQTRNCTLNSLRMLRKLIEFANADLKNDENQTKSKKTNNELEINNSVNQVSNVLKDFIDFILLKLLYVIANTSDYDIKNLSSEILQEIFEQMINKEKYDLYFAKIFEWIKIEEKIKIKSNVFSEENSEEDSEIINENFDNIYLDEKEKNYVKLGLNFLSILTSKENPNISNKVNQILEILIKNMKFEFNRFEKELDRQIENRNYIKLSKDAYSNQDYSTIIFEANKNINKNAETEITLQRNNNLELKEEDLTILNIQLENWDLFYLHLINIEKLLEIYPSIFSKKLNQDIEFSRILFRSIKHPHIFIKTTILRIISKLFSEESNILIMNDFDQVNRFINNLVIDKNSSCIGGENSQSNTIQIIFDNLKFIILNKDIDLKENIINSAVDISSFLVFLSLKLFIKNKKIQNNFEDFSFYAYEFICKLYAQSKKYMAKKEFTNKIIRRILIIIENIISYTNLKSNMFDLISNKNKNLINNNKIKKESDKFNKNTEQENKEKADLIEILLEPLLSLLFRLTTNNLIDEEIKVFSEKIIDSLRDLIKEDVFSKKYNDITKRITLLRRKRKIEQKEKILRK